jgi:hypothetical protein
MYFESGFGDGWIAVAALTGIVEAALRQALAVRRDGFLDSRRSSRGSKAGKALFATLPARVPEHTFDSGLDANYEVSIKLGSPTEFDKTCWAVSLSMGFISPPQRGQRQVAGDRGETGVPEHCCG